MNASSSKPPGEPAPCPRVVIVGCGFGGLEAARKLVDHEVDVTVIEKTNHHLFQPLLYQVATAGLAAPSIAAPARLLFRGDENVTTLLGEVTGIDATARQVHLADGTALPYDHLIVAAGATHSYFGNDQWAPLAPGLKTLADAFDIRRRVLMAFEMAELEADPVRRKALMTFVVIGAGPTGVEMAGTLAEIARHTLSGEFRHRAGRRRGAAGRGRPARAAGHARVAEPARQGTTGKARRAGAAQCHGDAHRRLGIGGQIGLRCRRGGREQLSNR